MLKISHNRRVCSDCLSEKLQAGPTNLNDSRKAEVASLLFFAVNNSTLSPEMFQNVAKSGFDCKPQIQAQTICSCLQ